MAAVLYTLTLLHHTNAVGMANGGEAMGDRNRGSILRNLGQGLLKGTTARSRVYR